VQFPYAPVNGAAVASLNIDPVPRLRPMKLRVSLSAALALLCLSTAALAGPPSAPHAAACVAALKAQEAALAESVKSGQPVEPDLLKVVRSGIAIIGTQYLAGLREVEARELLKAAEQDFQALAPDVAEARQSECLSEGEALYAQASSLERSLITSAAQRRIRRLTAST
jgi:hypothetical protein